MNILYLGPYRRNTLEGLKSECVLHSLLLSKQHVVISRPLYSTGSENVKEQIPRILKEAESQTHSTIDCVIQHTSPILSSRIPAINKNIIIPIIDSQIISQESADRLSRFDTVLIDNKIDSYRIFKSFPKLQKQIKHFDYDLHFAPISDGRFNISLLSAMEKIYFIGNYRDNSRLISAIIKSFIQNIGHNNVALVLFLLDLEPNEKQLLDQHIIQLHQAYGVQHLINRVVVAPIASNLENIVLAHQTGDVYLEIDNKTSTSINTKIAKGLQKKIMHFNHDISFSLQDNEQVGSRGFLVLSDQIVFDTIKAYLESRTLNTSPFFKTQHINSIL